MSTRTERLSKRYERRIARYERRLGRINAIEASGHKGALMAFVVDVANDLSADLDGDRDGKISIEEIVDEVAERLDDLIALEGMAELASDIGIKALAWAAVTIYKNRVTILQRRLARNRAKLAALQTSVAA